MSCSMRLRARRRCAWRYRLQLQMQYDSAHAEIQNHNTRTVVTAVTIQQRRLIALVDFAQQSLRSRTRVACDIASHDSFLLYEHQAREVPGLIEGRRADSDDEVWLCVPHPPGPQMPPQAESAWLSPWLTVGAGVNAPPQLATEIDGAALIGAGTHRDASAADAAYPAVDASARVSLHEYAFLAEVEA